MKRWGAGDWIELHDVVVVWAVGEWSGRQKEEDGEEGEGKGKGKEGEREGEGEGEGWEWEYVRFKIATYVFFSCSNLFANVFLVDLPNSLALGFKIEFNTNKFSFLSFPFFFH